MSINPASEQLKTLGQAANMLPRRRGDRPVHPTTLWRWCRRGVVHGGQRIYLEALKTPSGLATSAEALQRFLQVLSDDAVSPLPTTKSVTVHSALAQLDADGI